MAAARVLVVRRGIRDAALEASRAGHACPRSVPGLLACRAMGSALLRDLESSALVMVVR
jgi:hypothetical protein